MHYVFAASLALSFNLSTFSLKLQLKMTYESLEIMNITGIDLLGREVIKTFQAQLTMKFSCS